MSTLSQRCWCEIDFRAIQHNLKTIRKHIGKKPLITGLVKANAYGHGLIPVAKFLQTADCQKLACAHVHEGIQLRNAGVRLPILLLSGFLKEELPEILRHRLTPTISSFEDAKQIALTARNRNQRANVELKIDTGMGRLGVALEQFAELAEFVVQNKNLNLTGVYTHFACADSDIAFARRQWKCFQQTLAKSPLPSPVQLHICNSAGLLSLPEAHVNGVRPGIAIYGVSPLPDFQKLFKPALSWKTRVVHVKTVSKGTTLSYGATFRAPRKMQVAAIAVGYGDGLFRSLSNKGSVLIGGKRCPILGRVTMDQVLVDVGRVPAPKVRRGTEAVIIGKQGSQYLPASEIADLADTIPYEVFTRITARVPRVYKSLKRSSP